MTQENIPVPSGPRAKRNLRWVWWIAVPAAITIVYRKVPPETRSKWNPRRTANSHLALAAILAGGGWRAFFHFAHFSVKDGIPFWLDG
jgi:hypothetical protein